MNQHIPNKAIFLDQLQDMFSGMARESGWDLNSPLLWGYFFIHSEPTRLKAAVPALEAMGLELVDLFLAEQEEADDPDLYVLHMQEARVHTPESPDQRNDEFYLFAHQQGIDRYDGMDVGPTG